jgi:glyoxylase-like metal-dependent hydrolase (beta-lactamase superfamily II)
VNAVSAGGSGAAAAIDEVVAIRYGTLRSHRSELYHRYAAYGEADAPQDMDYFFYLLRSGDEVTVVDTGFDPQAARRRGRTCLVPPSEALERLGVDPARVRRLIISHFHWDHVGNLGLFPQAELVVPERELSFWSTPVARNLQFSSIVEEGEIAAIERAQREGRVVATGDDEQIAPSVRAITVGGHSPGQQVLVVEAAAGPVILASDAVHLYEEFELERPFGVVVDLREMCEAYAMLKGLAASLGAQVVPGHDPAVAQRFPSLGGDVDGLGYRVG